MARKTERVVRVTGPLTLEFSNGFRLKLVFEQTASPPKMASRPGRKPSPATQTVIAAMKEDGGKPRSRADYLAMLRRAGHRGSDHSAALIVNREAKRIFGRPLGRARSPEPVRRTPGRQASPATTMLRAKLADDRQRGGVAPAKTYVRWLVDHADVGIRKARPIVYRELRAVR